MRLLEPGHLEEHYPIKFFKNKRLSFFFCKRNNNIHEFKSCFLRGQINSNDFEVFNCCIVEPWILLVRVPRTWESFVFKKRWDWIIFFQVPWFKQSHCTVIDHSRKYQFKISVSLGSENGPKRNWKQCLCKILGWQTENIMVCYGISGVVNYEVARGVANPQTCRPGPTNFWFKQSTAYNTLCVVGVI